MDDILQGLREHGAFGKTSITRGPSVIIAILLSATMDKKSKNRKGLMYRVHFCFFSGANKVF